MKFQVTRSKRQYAILTLVISIVGYVLIYIVSQIISPFFRDVFFGGDLNQDFFTFQIFMWFPFFLGIAHLWDRRIEQKKMMNYLYKEDFLSGDENEILAGKDLAAILSRVRQNIDAPPAVVNRIIHQVALKYQSNKSVEQASTMLSSQLDMLSHRLDLAYSLVRYLSWLIPTLGFMGTVYGIALAVNVVGQSNPQDPALLSNVAGSLAIAFNTTLLALIQSAILLYFVHVFETKDEFFVNDLSHYVQRQLINRLE